MKRPDFKNEIEKIDGKPEKIASISDVKALGGIKEYYVIFVTLSILLCSAVGYYGEYNLLNRFDISIAIYAEIDDFFLAGLKSLKIFIQTIIFAVILITVIYVITIIFNSSKVLDIYIKSDSYQNAVNKLNEAKSIENQVYETHDNVESHVEQIENLRWDKKWFFKLQRWFAGKSVKQLIQKSNENIKIIREKNKYVDSNIELVNEISLLRRKRIGASIIVVVILIIDVAIYSWSMHITLKTNLQNELNRIIENPVSMATVTLKNKITIPNNLALNRPLVFITATNKFMFFYQHGTNEKISTFAIPISSILSVYYSDFKIKTTNSDISSNNDTPE